MQRPPDVEVLRWVVARSARLAAAGCCSEPLFPEAPEAARKMRPQYRPKHEPTRWPRVKTDESDRLPCQSVGSLSGPASSSSFIWGEFIPCDICVDVVMMLHLQNRFGSRLKHLQSHLPMSKARQQGEVPQGPGNAGRSYSYADMGELRQFLATSGVSIQGVADAASQYYAIARKMARAGFGQSAGASRAMPPSLLAVPMRSQVSQHAHGLAAGIEGLVWRLQLVLAAAYLPFGFSHIRDSSMQAPFNLGQQPRTHFAYNVLCYDAFRKRPDLRCQEALMESLHQSISVAPSTSWRFPPWIASSGVSSSSAVALDGSSRHRRQSNHGKGVEAIQRRELSSGCLCSYSFLEGCTEVPSLHQGHLEPVINSGLAVNTEMNGERWSQLEFIRELRLLLRSGCSVKFRLKLAAVLLREADPTTFSCRPPHARAPAGEVREWRDAQLLLHNSLATWMARQKRAYVKLSNEFSGLCLRLSNYGILEDARGCCLSPPASRPFNSAELDTQAGGTARASRNRRACRPSEWLTAMRELDGFIAQALLHAADVHPTRLVAQTLYALLVERPNEAQQLLNEQRGDWPSARFQVERMDRARQEVTAALTQPSVVRRLASCFAPLRFFSLAVKAQIPLADLLLCEGWDLDLKNICPGEVTGPLQRVQELLTPLLSRGSRALLPTDVRGVAEAVREFYSSKQVQARQQQARGNSKRAKGDGRLRYIQSQKAAQTSQDSLWVSLVEEHIDKLHTAAAALTHTRTPQCQSVNEGQMAGMPRLLKTAAETTQVVSAYWRRCSLVHAQPNARRAQLLVFGDSRRRALLQWLHRAARAVDTGAASKRQGELRGPELEFVNQPLWAAMLPFADQHGGASAPQGEGTGAAVPVPSAEEDEQVQELLLEATETARSAAGGALANEPRLLELVALAIPAASRLLELQQIDFEKAEEHLKVIADQRKTTRRPTHRPTAADPSAGEVGIRRDEPHWKESSSVKTPPETSKDTKYATKDAPAHRPFIKLEPEPLERQWSPRGPEEPNDGRAVASSSHQSDAYGGRDLGRRDNPASSPDERYAQHDGPFFSVSHRFLREFLALDAEGRSKRRVRGRPSTARVCRIAEQSILHSNGPFYPESKTE